MKKNTYVVKLTVKHNFSIRENTMPSASEAKQNDAEGGEDYPDGELGVFLEIFYLFVSGSSEVGEEIEDLLCLDLTHEEIKAAFRYTL